MHCRAWPFRVSSVVTVPAMKGLGSSAEDGESLRVRILVTPRGAVMVSLDTPGDRFLKANRDYNT